MKKKNKTSTKITKKPSRSHLREFRTATFPNLLVSGLWAEAAGPGEKPTQVQGEHATESD